MNREQMVANVVARFKELPPPSLVTLGPSNEEFATRILDAILPQITTVAELEALPHNVVVMAPRSGVCMRQWEAVENGWPGTPALTVVWQPEVTA